MLKNCHIYVFNTTYELNRFSFFDISSNRPYFNIKAQSFTKSPLYKSLLESKKMKVTCYFSGLYLDILSQHKHEINALNKFIKNGQIELLLGPYYHSFSSLFSKKLFIEEIIKHKELLMNLFGIQPNGFVNTLAIFSDELITMLQKEEVSYVIAPLVEWYFENNTSHLVVKSKDEKLDLVLVGESKVNKNIAINYFSGESIAKSDLEFITASKAVDDFSTSTVYQLPNPIGLSPQNQNLEYFLENTIQKQAFQQIQNISSSVLKSEDKTLKESLLMLSTPAIFSNLSSDKTSRYDDYISMINCISDLELRCT